MFVIGQSPLWEIERKRGASGSLICPYCKFMVGLELVAEAANVLVTNLELSWMLGVSHAQGMD